MDNNDFALHLETCAFCIDLEDDWSGLLPEDVERLQQQHFEEWEAAQEKAAEDLKQRTLEGD